jgi:hypothetical protein
LIYDLRFTISNAQVNHRAKSKAQNQESKRDSIGRFIIDGFQIIPRLISDSECDFLALELSELFESQQSSTKNKIGGVRNLLRNCKRVKEIATSPKVVSYLEDLLGQKTFPVRAIFFDKTAESNWHVPWHQDLTISVLEQIKTAGFAAWSVKGEVIHVQPPLKILEGMAAIRLHLDPCDANNGALKVIPGSHLLGRLGANEVAKQTQQNDAVVCEVPKGGVLLMRPLLLHSSSPAKIPSHRRVLHIEYATQRLPNGLRWFDV